MSIRILPEGLASRIAAGEVIECPASVVKELIENSIDAGSTSIMVTLIQGGKTRIVVEDDGHGIAKEDLELAILRHATSKITDMDDLARINTLGFRGEALASISSVSRLDIRSRTIQRKTGSVIQTEAGKIISISDLNCNQGTRVQVDDLFFNLPARRKFLKSTVGEFRRISQLVRYFSFSYPNIDFVLNHDGKKIFSTRGKSTYKKVLELIWGCEPDISFRNHISGNVSVDCWIQKQPGKKKLRLQSFVNGRIIQDSMVRAALHSALGEISANVALSITLPADQVDVNIHPAKTEVRFRYSKEIFDSVREAVSEISSENSVNILPSVVFSSRGLSKDISAPSLSGETYVRQNEEPSLFSRVAQPPEIIHDGADNLPPVCRTVEENISVCINEETTFVGQLSMGYLVIESRGSLFIMDHHAAHERVIFERIRERSGSGRTTISLVCPLQVPHQYVEDVTIFSEDLENCGFEFSKTDEKIFLKTIPQCIGDLEGNPFEYLSSLIMMWNEGVCPIVDGAVLLKWATMACKASVKLTTTLTAIEVLSLWNQLMDCSNPFSCPHGRPTVLELSGNHLENYFGR